MADIMHRIAIRAPPEKVYDAVSTPTGLAGWWTTNVKGDGRPGSVADFGFADRTTRMRIDQLQPGKSVAWTCLAGPPEWIGSTVHFEFTPSGDGTVVRFLHRDHLSGDFYGHCNTKWGFFLISLKSLVEKGVGLPYPRDLDL